MLEQTGAQAIGNIVPVAAQYGHGILSYLKSECDYVRNLSKNFDKLKDEEIRLCNIETDVENEKQRNPTMERTSQCSGWLTEVRKMKDKTRDLSNRYDNTSRRLCGFYPFRSLLKLGKDIVTMTKEVIHLREEEKTITKMVPRSPVSVIKKHPMKIEDMPSLDEQVKRLIMYLKNDKLKTIGVFGLPGMGKTMVMEHLNDRVGELFEIVFYVTLPVPEMEIVKGIQKKIVEQLNLRVEDHLSSSMKAGIISEALANRKYLLLLDQVSSKINLKEVGIHVDNHNHGRVVFACRDRSFCEFTDEEIEIKGLSEDDAKKLFREIVGGIIDRPTYQKIGKRLLDLCSGVPHLIKLTAARLRKEKDYGTWKSVLDRMQTPEKRIWEEMEEFYKAVELIYDSLSKDWQSCLLHWAIFPPDSELYQEYLIECWIGERLIAGDDINLGCARNEGHEIVTAFESKNLVERGRKVGHFKMPLFLRHMALKLAYNRENNLKILVARGEIGEQPLEDSLIRRISFTLPVTPPCSEISTLLLQKNPSLTNIPDFAFNYMSQLCVLDLYDTRITSLPPSISSLIKLRVLYLNSCVQLVTLPPQIGKLKRLEILDLRGTGILSLPEVLAQMTGLKCLRVSFKEQNFGCINHTNVQRPEMIPSGVIKKLSSLQELSIDIDFKNQIWNQIVVRVAEEVATLKELTSLCFYFPTLFCFRTFIQTCMLNRRGGDCLESFRIQVGNHEAENFLQFDFFGYTDERHLRISKVEVTSGGELISVELSKLFNPVTTLEFIGHDSENLSIFSAEDLNLVETCTIKECNAMKSIIDGAKTTGVTFKFLCKLHLINLPQLVSICKGSIDSTSLNSLTTLTLKSCPKLNCLFPKYMIQPLCNLQDLKVEDCSELKEVIEVGSVVQTVAFSKLKNMELVNLPELFRLCEDNSFEWLSFEIMKIMTCPKLKELPFSKENAPSLRKIECTSEWWSDLNGSVKDRLEGLHSFV